MSLPLYRSGRCQTTSSIHVSKVLCGAFAANFSSFIQIEYREPNNSRGARRSQEARILKTIVINVHPARQDQVYYKSLARNELVIGM